MIDGEKSPAPGGNQTYALSVKRRALYRCDTTAAHVIVKTSDPFFSLKEIERHARYLATSVDNMIENLAGILQSISALTVESLETYRDGVCKTCDEVILFNSCLLGDLLH